MEMFGESLEALGWATDVVNAVRVALENVNVPLPAVLAQVLTLGVFAGVVHLFVKRFRAARLPTHKTVYAIVAGAAGIAVVSIVCTWIDHALYPRSKQIIGRLDGSYDGLYIGLVDAMDQPIGADLETDSRGTFVITYHPAFADPPGALVVAATDCEGQRVPLRRSHLLGGQLSLRLLCRGGDD